MKEPYEVPTADRLYLISLLVDLAFSSEETLDRFGKEIQDVIYQVTKYNGRSYPSEDMYRLLSIHFKSDHVLWVFVDAYHGETDADQSS
jgi:hypothetical protein